MPPLPINSNKLCALTASMVSMCPSNVCLTKQLCKLYTYTFPSSDPLTTRHCI